MLNKHIYILFSDLQIGHSAGSSSRAFPPVHHRPQGDLSAHLLQVKMQTCLKIDLRHGNSLGRVGKLDSLKENGLGNLKTQVTKMVRLWGEKGGYSPNPL